MANEKENNKDYANIIITIFRNIYLFILEFPKYSLLIFLISLFIIAFLCFITFTLQILILIAGLILSQSYSIDIINYLLKLFKIEELHISGTYGADQKPLDLIAISKKIAEIYFFSILLIELIAKLLKKYIKFQIPEFTTKKKILYSAAFFIIAYIPGLFIFPIFALIFLIISISISAIYFAYSAFLNFMNKFFNLIQESNESQNKIN